MSKMTISESRFNQLLKESINEAIMEAMEDEGRVGDWLRNAYGTAKRGVNNAVQSFKNNGGLAGMAGNAYQWGRNQISNAQKNFEAGRLYQRAKNVDYDPMTAYRSKYGNDFANKMLAQRGNQYAKNRYEKMKNVWNGETPSPDVTEPQPLSAAVNTAATSQQAPTMKQNPETRKRVADKSQAMLKQTSDFLRSKGFALRNGQWVYAQDNSNWPALKSEYPDIVAAAKKYNMALKGAQGLYETIIKESVDAAFEKFVGEIKEKDGRKWRPVQRLTGTGGIGNAMAKNDFDENGKGKKKARK